MATITTRATLDDLLKTDGKAELIGGRIVHFMASGHLPSVVALEITVSLREYARRNGRGVAYADGMGFAVPELPSGRESFSPDSSYYVGPLPRTGCGSSKARRPWPSRCRSENDFGDAAEAEIVAEACRLLLRGHARRLGRRSRGGAGPCLPVHRSGASHDLRPGPDGRSRARRAGLADGCR